MGLVRSLCTFIMWPVVLNVLIIAHIVYQAGYQEPQPPTVTSWPKDLKQNKIDAIIKSRAPIVKALKAQNDYKQIVSLMTEDAVFECPFFKLGNRDEVATGGKKVDELFLKNDLTFHGEYHGPNEILIEYTAVLVLKAFPSNPIKSPGRIRISLEPSKGGSEKIFKIVESWYGNELLTEKTTVSYLGKFHQMYRRFVGHVGVSAIKNGWL